MFLFLLIFGGLSFIYNIMEFILTNHVHFFLMECTLLCIEIHSLSNDITHYKYSMGLVHSFVIHLQDNQRNTNIMGMN